MRAKSPCQFGAARRATEMRHRAIAGRRQRRDLADGAPESKQIGVGKGVGVPVVRCSRTKAVAAKGDRWRGPLDPQRNRSGAGARQRRACRQIGGTRDIVR
jgi:hypothetical protein